MLIYLYDHPDKTDVQLNVTVEYSTACSDMYVMFYSENETCSLAGGDSSEYHCYTIKKILYINGVSFEKSGHQYFLELAYYLTSDGQLEYFIVKESGTSGYFRYADCTFHDGDHIAKNFRLFSSGEFEQVQTLMRMGQQSDRSFIERLIEKDISQADYSLYNLVPKMVPALLEGKTEFIRFLDREELRLKSTVQS